MLSPSGAAHVEPLTERLAVWWCARVHRDANEAKGLRDKALSLDAARWCVLRCLRCWCHRALRLTSSHPLCLSRFARYVAHIVAALEYLHLEKHVVHRDLKPENILITADGHVQITDFGTAKDKHVPKELLTAFVGTAEYVSPEVLADDEATRAVDLWALGCITFQVRCTNAPLHPPVAGLAACAWGGGDSRLHVCAPLQLLVGRPPFRGGSEYLTFQQIMHYPDSHSLDYPAGFPQVARVRGVGVPSACSPVARAARG